MKKLLCKLWQFYNHGMQKSAWLYLLLLIVPAGPGESIEVAETEAAAVALKNLLGIPEKRPPLPLDSVRHSHVNKTVCKTLHEKINQKRLAVS